jgi:hypothetical protein
VGGLERSGNLLPEVSMESETLKSVAVRSADRRVWNELGYLCHAGHLSEMQLEMDYYAMSFV